MKNDVEIAQLLQSMEVILLRICDEQVPLFSSDRLHNLHRDCRDLLNRVVKCRELAPQNQKTT